MDLTGNPETFCDHQLFVRPNLAQGTQTFVKIISIDHNGLVKLELVLNELVVGVYNRGNQQTSYKRHPFA